MTRRISTLGAAGLLASVLALAGCSRDPAPGAVGAPALIPTSSYQFAGRGAFSRVERWIDAEGNQQLRSDTLLSSDPNLPAAESLRLTESARLDPRGWLMEADVCRKGAAAEVCFRLDAKRGVARMERPGEAPVEWNVPTDAPWVYQASSGDAGTLVSTPLSGWVALRAANGQESVRVLEPARQESRLVPVDQLAVPTEKGTTVVLAGDGIDVGEAFVEQVRLLDRGTTLSLIPPAKDPGS